MSFFSSPPPGPPPPRAQEPPSKRNPRQGSSSSSPSSTTAAPTNPSTKPPRPPILPSSLFHPLLRADGVRPLYDLIPSRAVVAAEKSHGYGSPEHLAALHRAESALRLYIQGRDCLDPLDRPSPQQRIFARPEKEIAMGGGRGGSKSMSGILFASRGNYYEPVFLRDPRTGAVTENDPVHLSYLYHPHYFALVIRRNREDLKQWIDEARSVYERSGGKWFPGDHCFRWYTAQGIVGAQIYTGHLADPDSYRHYIGLNIHTLIIEELIQLAEEGPYDELRASVRSKFPELIPRILVNFNPTGGPGVGWVYDRFIEPKLRLDDGRKIPICYPGTADPIRSYNHDYTPIYPEPTVRVEVDVSVYHRLGIDPPPPSQRFEDRAFIPARLIDNPYLMHNFSYVNSLASMPKALRDSYLFGIWSFSGAYFDTFRPKGPLPGEPPEANHVIPTFPSPAIVLPRTEADGGSLTVPSMQVEYWWPRVLGGDWGYEHEFAFYWCATNPHTKQRIFYREFVASRSTPEEVGARIAEKSLPDLLSHPSHALTLWIGFDPSIANRIGQDRTLFEYLSKGISYVLKHKFGSDCVHFPDFKVRQLQEQAFERGEEADERLLESIRRQRRAGITIRLSKHSRIMGWQLMQEYLRWDPILEGNEGMVGFDPSTATRLLLERGHDEYRRYVLSCQGRKIELLPKWLICDCCPRLIEALPKLQRESRDGKSPEDADPRHFTGMDSCDAARYTLAASREEEAYEPMETFVERRMSDLLSSAPSPSHYSINDLVRIRNGLEREHAASAAPTILSPRHRSTWGMQKRRKEVAKLLGIRQN